VKEWLAERNSALGNSSVAAQALGGKYDMTSFENTLARIQKAGFSGQEVR